MNIINDPWLFVEYLDGTTTQVSVRQAFTDAEKIRKFVTPCFHKTVMYAYDIPVIQLFVTILQAAYYKPEYDFIAKDEFFSKNLMTNGWDDKVLFGYLDKWSCRFNLFDEKYPFLQDITLQPTGSEGHDYLTTVNPFAPCANNVFFGKIRSVCKDRNDPMAFYEMDETELAYHLLFENVFGHSPCGAQYPHKAVSFKAGLNIIPEGKNIRETIIFNCLPLEKSSRPVDEYESDIMYDRPVWELNSQSEILNYDMANVCKNKLLCTFFPGFHIRAFKEDGKIVEIVLGRDIKESVFNKEDMDSLRDNYVIHNPWAIYATKEDKKTKEKTYFYKQWYPTIKLMSLCLEITSNLPDSISCNIVDQELQKNHGATCLIYFREMDDKFANVLSCGRYEVRQEVFDKLQDEQNHEKASQVCKRMDAVLSNMRSTVSRINKYSASIERNSKTLISKESFRRIETQFVDKVVHYFFNEFIDNIDKEDITTESFKQIHAWAKELMETLADSCKADFIEVQNQLSLFSYSLYKLDEKAKKQYNKETGGNESD